MTAIATSETGFLVDMRAAEWQTICGVASGPKIGDAGSVAQLYEMCADIQNHLKAAKDAVSATRAAADKMSQTIEAIEA